jgi:HEPN domain-containing protein
VERRIREPDISRTWATLIAHDIEYVSRRISKAAYFFADIKKEGICLYTSGNHRLAPLRQPDPRERLGQARTCFKDWFKTAEMFMSGYGHYSAWGVEDRDFLRLAAFELHQAAENLYHTLLLVFTGYKPKLHDLEKLKRLTGGFGRELLMVFPSMTEEERNRFQLLKRAYTGACYERGYRVEKEDLDYLADRVRRLQEAVKPLCEQRIAKYEKGAEAWRTSGWFTWAACGILVEPWGALRF